MDSQTRQGLVAFVIGSSFLLLVGILVVRNEVSRSSESDRADDRVSSWDGKLYFVYLVGWNTIKNGGRDPFRDRVMAIVQDLDIPVIDVYPAILNHDDPMSLFPFGFPNHYNEEGYRIVAETTLETLEPVLREKKENIHIP